MPHRRRPPASSAALGYTNRGRSSACAPSLTQANVAPSPSRMLPLPVGRQCRFGLSASLQMKPSGTCGRSRWRRPALRKPAERRSALPAAFVLVVVFLFFLGRRRRSGRGGRRRSRPLRIGLALVIGLRALGFGARLLRGSSLFGTTREDRTERKQSKNRQHVTVRGEAHGRQFAELSRLPQWCTIAAHAKRAMRGKSQGTRHGVSTDLLSSNGPQAVLDSR